ncbi:hypothetical protein [Microcoleus sp. D3_18_C4]
MVDLVQIPIALKNFHHSCISQTEEFVKVKSTLLRSAIALID